MQATTDPKKIAMKETNHIDGSKGKINVSHPVSRLGFKINRASLLGKILRFHALYRIESAKWVKRVSGGVKLI